VEYTIDLSSLMIQRLWALRDEAARWGQQTAFDDSLLPLRHAITSAPNLVGEILYHLQSDVRVRLAVRGPLAVNFAIHEPTRTVWFVKVSRLSAPGEGPTPIGPEPSRN
jgi:hypothetical protein